MIEAKRYLAATLPEALRQVKSELGPDAVILHSQPVHVGGLFGLFSQRAVEVRAAAMPTEDDVRSGTRQLHQWKPRQLDRNESMVQIKGSSAPPHPGAPLRNLPFEQFSQQLGEASTLLASAYRSLQSEGIEDRLVQEIILQAKVSLTLDTLGCPDSLHLALKNVLLTKLPRLTIRLDAPPHLIFLQGPTGVGKSTTAVKLAGLFQSRGLRPALLTTDVFRVGAIAQMEAFARLMDLPLAVAYDPQELATKVETWSSYDVVLIDTPGMGEAQSERLAELQHHMQTLSPLSNFLVISATAKTEDMLSLVETFTTIASIDGIIATKLDESRHLGGLYSVLHATQTPLAFSTSGQKVPEDLTVGGAESLVARIMAPWLAAVGIAS